MLSDIFFVYDLCSAVTQGRGAAASSIVSRRYRSSEGVYLEVCFRICDTAGACCSRSPFSASSNGVLLRSLPFPEPDPLVKIFFNNPGMGMRV